MEEFMQSLNFTHTWWAFLLPVILMLMDIITGYYNGWKNNELSSSKMRDGLGKKMAELCCICIGVLFKYAFGLDAVMYFVILYVVFMELLSVLENCDKLGFNMSDKLKEKLNNKEK